MSILTKEALSKENKGNALLIGSLAREAKKLNPSVIDSTIGMLYDENSNFYTFKTVEKALNELNSKERYSYGKSSGSKEFADAVNSWVFQQYLDEFKNELYIETLATPGGTGAVSCVIANYLNKGDNLLVPNYMWTNYIQMAKERGCGYTTYNMFNSLNEFDISNFENSCIELKKNQGRVVVVINDPCQNPTGYSMSYSDWIGVVQVLNDISRDGTPVVLIYDMAYIDYDKRGFEASRKNFRLLKHLNPSVLTTLCFSGSKTLGLYGLRVGALIGISSSQEEINLFKTACDFTCRGIWSGTSTLGQNIVYKVLTKYKEEFMNELEEARKILIERANTFIEEASKVSLYHLPYNCGFFVTIPVADPNKAYEALKEKGLYILPINNAIRLTLSSITLEEISRAVKIIKETI